MGFNSVFKGLMLPFVSVSVLLCLCRFPPLLSVLIW